MYLNGEQFSHDQSSPVNNQIREEGENKEAKTAYHVRFPFP